MTHGYTRHFMLLSLSLVVGAVSVAACDAVTGEPAESRLYECKYDCEESSSGDDDGGYESSSSSDDDGGGYESSSGGDECEYGEYGCDDENKGCTLTQGYWKNHNIEAKNMNQKLPWPEVYAGKVSEYLKLPKDGGTGEMWLAALKLAPKGDPRRNVAHQWIAARLNIANGAGAPLAVKGAIVKLDKYLDGKGPCDGKKEALVLAALLDDYNNGKVGPPHCGDKENLAMTEKYDYEADICDGKGKAVELEFKLKEQ